MPISETSAVERIARVLAGQRLSVNGEGNETSGATVVNAEWEYYVDDARSVLRTLREPDHAMAGAGDVEIWERMVRAALGEGDNLFKET